MDGCFFGESRCHKRFKISKFEVQFSKNNAVYGWFSSAEELHDIRNFRCACCRYHHHHIILCVGPKRHVMHMIPMCSDAPGITPCSESRRDTALWFYQGLGNKTRTISGPGIFFVLLKASHASWFLKYFGDGPLLFSSRLPPSFPVAVFAATGWLRSGTMARSCINSSHDQCTGDAIPAASSCGNRPRSHHHNFLQCPGASRVVELTGLRAPHAL